MSTPRREEHEVMTTPAKPMRVPLQEWYDGWLSEHRRGTNLLYAHPSDPRLHQVHFVRDVLAPLLWRGVKYDDVPNHEGARGDCKAISWVVGEHRSKSVRLPVFEIGRPAIGLRMVMRYNFHDWNVSVISECPLKIDLSDVPGAHFSDHDRGRYQPGGFWGYLFFQGFPDDACFASYAHNTQRFSFEVVNDHELYAVTRDLLRATRAA